ncbi:MAG: hypothetical protein M1516_01395, partial [Firmicutes bacterium]|nr:hypothetical protein [Bacillota bacterium]
AYVEDDKGDSFARQVAAAYIPASAFELPLRFSMSPQRDRRLGQWETETAFKLARGEHLVDPE